MPSRRLSGLCIKKPWRPQKQAKVNWGMPYARLGEHSPEICRERQGRERGRRKAGREKQAGVNAQNPLGLAQSRPLPEAALLGDLRRLPAGPLSCLVALPFSTALVPLLTHTPYSTPITPLLREDKPRGRPARLTPPSAPPLDGRGRPAFRSSESERQLRAQTPAPRSPAGGRQKLRRRRRRPRGQAPSTPAQSCYSFPGPSFGPPWQTAH
ncbi:hypothetical protein AAY473_021266 [Plecturocebus cupreus]